MGAAQRKHDETEATPAQQEGKQDVLLALDLLTMPEGCGSAAREAGHAACVEASERLVKAGLLRKVGAEKYARTDRGFERAVKIYKLLGI